MTEVLSCPHVSKITLISETDVTNGVRVLNLTDKSVIFDTDEGRFVVERAWSLLPLVDNIIPAQQENVMIIVPKDVAAIYRKRDDVNFPGDVLGEYYNGLLKFCPCCIENDDKEKTD